MEVECEQVEAIRETSRNTLQVIRRRHKDEETDHRRCIDTSLKVIDVVQIANKLKTKASITAAELQSLKNALYADNNKIEIVLSTHGALRGLVRELTGVNVNNQCGAAGCLCNLALGDSKATMAVAKAAGAYLISELDSLTIDLATTSAWTIGNLSASCQRVSAILVAQGAITKLIEMLQTNEEKCDAAVYALTRIVYSMGDELSTEHLHKILEAMSTVKLNDATCQLLFYLSCYDDFHYNTEGTNKLINELNIINIESNLTKCSILDYLLRILSNINNEILYRDLLNYFVEQNFVGKFKCLLSSDLCDTVLWLLGNMYKCCGDHIFFNMICD